jgi:V/A-type H+-transporting ATPase subunit I
VLVVVADAGVTQLEGIGEPAPGLAGEAFERALRQQVPAAPATTLAGPRILAEPPDAAALEQAGRLEELAGEVELERAAAAALRHGVVVAIVGWSPAAAVATLADRLAPLGGAVVRLPFPRWPAPPTLVASTGATGAFQPLVDTYATVPYADLNPAAVAGIAYVVMFGMMFGDVGDGALLLAAGLLLAVGRLGRLSRFRRFAPFVIGAGLASICFGLAFGEFFGPTHVVPTLWMAPLDDPTTLLAVAIAVGAALIAAAYALGTINRWREGGLAGAALASAGLAGAALYLGLAVLALGWYEHATVMLVAGGVLAVVGLGLVALGSYLTAGPGAGRSAEAGVESFDAVVRIGTNTVSFARLAAFGLTHAALCAVVWSGTTWLWGHGPASWLAAVALFVAGNVVAFALEGLVVGVQALRLEYYELFSRIFVDEGRPFRPWHVPTISSKEAA